MNNTLSYFTARASQLPSDETDRLERITASGGDRFVVTFGASVVQNLIWNVPIVPTTYQNGDLYIDIRCAMATATTGSVKIQVSVEASTDIGVDETSFDTANLVTDSVPDTAGEVFVVTIPLTNKDSVAVGDALRLKVERVLSGATATGTLYVLGAIFYEEIDAVTLDGDLEVDSLTASSASLESAGMVPLTIKGADSQSANLTEWQEDDGDPLLSITSSGSLNFLADAGLAYSDEATLKVTNGSTSYGTIQAGGNNGGFFLYRNDGENIGSFQATSDFYADLNMGGVYLRGYSSVFYLNALGGVHINNGPVLLQGFAAGNVGLTIQGAASQSANLLELQDSDGDLLSAFTATGQLRINGGSQYAQFGYETNNLLIDARNVASGAILRVPSGGGIILHDGVSQFEANSTNVITNATNGYLFAVPGGVQNGADTGLARASAGIVKVTDGSSGLGSSGSGHINAKSFQTAQSTLTYGATTNIDLAAGGMRTITLTGDVTFTTSNRAAERTVTLRIIGDSSERTLTFPSWVFVGTEPATIAADKTAILTLTAFGTADTDIIAAYAVQE
jgi:hypothetical protein